MISGTPANDVLMGTAAADSLFGADGDDELFGNDGDDYVDGENGRDTLHGGPGNDEMHGRNDDDVVLGNEGDDRIYGDRGNDTINGGPGNDQIYGGLDDDVDPRRRGRRPHQVVAGGFDRVSCGAGNDTVFADTTTRSRPTARTCGAERARARVTPRRAADWQARRRGRSADSGWSSRSSATPPCVRVIRARIRGGGRT